MSVGASGQRKAVLVLRDSAQKFTRAAAELGSAGCYSWCRTALLLRVSMLGQ